MGDKELVEVWRKEFIGLSKSYCDTEICSNGLFLSRHAELMFDGFCLAKRSHPSVVLPSNAEINHLAVDTAGEYDWNTIEAKEKYIKAFTDGAIIIFDDISRSLTAAGIKYTIGE